MRRAVVHDERLHDVARREADHDLIRRPEVHDALDHPGNSVVAGLLVRPYADALGTNHDARLAARRRHAPRGPNDEVTEARTAVVAVGPLDRHRHQVRHAEEVRDEDRLRLLVHLLGRGDLLDVAAVHHGDPVGHRERLFLVVRHIHKGDLELLLDRLQLQLQVLAQLRVERTERLVE